MAMSPVFFAADFIEIHKKFMTCRESWTPFHPHPRPACGRSRLQLSNSHTRGRKAVYRDVTGTGEETAYRKTNPKAEPGFHGLLPKVPTLFLSVLLVSPSAESKTMY